MVALVSTEAVEDVALTLNVGTSKAEECSAAETGLATTAEDKNAKVNKVWNCMFDKYMSV